MDPRQIVSNLLSGEVSDFVQTEQHQTLIVAEQAICEGHMGIYEDISHNLNQVEQQIIQFRIAQMSNDANLAQECLANALENSRSKENRDHLLEARIRMEWGVLRSSLGQMTEAGVDLRWAVERLGAISEGHRWHGLSLLNMAAWHQNRGEYGMALAMHSEISRHGPHLVEIVAMSRRRAAELLIEKNHIYSALRNLWIAHQGFLQTDMTNEAIEAGLHWIDLGLTEVSIDAPT
ncbi:MAG: hypothetical protein P8Q90_00980, partial [Candidatus Thalassarchaeaceae archaeon]|nr:hypothetical protein [Candidatus Thalassarchaeaceae archaeon]